MAQPAKVLYVLTTAPAQRPKETDLRLAESVVHASTDDKPGSEPTVPAGDQESSPTQGESKASSLPMLSYSCIADGVSKLCDKSVGNSESPGVREQLPVSGSVSEHETNEQE